MRNDQNYNILHSVAGDRLQGKVERVEGRRAGGLMPAIAFVEAICHDSPSLRLGFMRTARAWAKTRNFALFSGKPEQVLSEGAVSRLAT